MAIGQRATLLQRIHNNQHRGYCFESYSLCILVHLQRRMVELSPLETDGHGTCPQGLS